MSALRRPVHLLLTIIGSISVSMVASSQEIEISAVSPESRAVFEQARDAFHRAWFERANELLDETLALDADLAIAQAYKAVAESFLYFDPSGRTSLALDLAAAATPGERLMVSALVAFADGDYEPAAVALRRLTEQYPDDSYARHALGFTLVDLGLSRQGLAVLQGLLEDQPGFFAAWNHLGYAYLDLGELDLAAQAMTRFVASDPANPSARDSLADVMIEAGRLDEAIAGLTRAIMLEGGYGYGYQHLGDVLVMDGNPAMARRAYELGFEEGTAYSPRFELLARERIAAAWIRQLQHDSAVSALEDVRTRASALNEPATALAANRAQLTIRLSTSDAQSAAEMLATYAAAVDALGDEASGVGEPTYLIFFEGWHAVSQGRFADAEAALGDLEDAADRADPVALLLGARLLGEISLAQLEFVTAIESFEAAGSDDPLVALRLAVAYEGDGKPAAAAALFDEAAACSSFNIECALARALAAPLFDPSLALPDFGIPGIPPEEVDPTDDPDEGAVRI